MTVCAFFLLKMAACFCRVFLLKKHFTNIEWYIYIYSLFFLGALAPFNLEKTLFYWYEQEEYVYTLYRQKQVVSRE